MAVAYVKRQSDSWLSIWSVLFQQKGDFIRFYSKKSLKMTTVEELQKMVKELKARLAARQGDARPARQKIEVMSSEVVDSNPYRYFNYFLY